MIPSTRSCTGGTDRSKQGRIPNICLRFNRLCNTSISCMPRLPDSLSLSFSRSLALLTVTSPVLPPPPIDAYRLVYTFFARSRYRSPVFLHDSSAYFLPSCVLVIPDLVFFLFSLSFSFSYLLSPCIFFLQFPSYLFLSLSFLIFLLSHSLRPTVTPFRGSPWPPLHGGLFTFLSAEQATVR